MAKLFVVRKEPCSAGDYGAEAVALFVDGTWHSSVEGEAPAAAIARFTQDALKALGVGIKVENVKTTEWMEFDRFAVHR